MDTELVLKRIKNLELTSATLGIMAPLVAALLATDNRMMVLLLIGGAGVLLQPYIYVLYKKINQTDAYKQKRFWPLVGALALILFLAIKWKYF